jgi:hypothetical protein
MDETSMMWFRLRERRASLLNRWELQGNRPRQQTFAAAMTQFEEQMSAAKIVSPATRPLNLFYGLTQAGMAIVAAHAPGQWSFSRHGLKLLDTSRDLADIQVQPDGDGAFQRVAAAVGSTQIAEPVCIGSLWSSLPDLIDFTALSGTAKPEALRVTSDLRSPGFISSGSRPIGTFYHEPAAVRIRVKVAETDSSDPESWIREFMKNYPALRDWKIDAAEWPIDDGHLGDEIPIRMWLPGSVSDQSIPASEMSAIIDDAAPEYRYHAERYVRPSIGDSDKPTLSPLMTWWLLLYSFSMLARYQPRKWTRLLDLDKPGCAASLQLCLEVALSVIPHLILEALDRERFLLSNPDAPLARLGALM